NYIVEQMKKEMKESNMDKTYWVKGVGGQDKGPFDGSKKIKPTQNFYINKHHQLVIAFDKYEVAPGYMGLVEFKIPTKIIQKDLVSNQYIKK
ncbi:MAG TPA: RsiV family protein, partial [Rummeliibacillus sp.]|nr:RsiV family protein [Rummeliibacillus sp.]